MSAPVSPDRGTGQTWAREELARPEYHRDRGSIWLRAVDWVRDRVADLVNGSGLTRGHLLVITVLAVLVLAAVVLSLRHRIRGRTARDAHHDPVFDGSVLQGSDHRRNAALALAQGRLADAVRESMRAIARRLDERGLLDGRPGQTADELAQEATRPFPHLGEELRQGALTFDRVVYGRATPTLADAERLERLDRLIESSQPHQPHRSNSTDQPTYAGEGASWR